MGIRIVKEMGYSLPLPDMQDERLKWESVGYDALEEMTKELFLSRVNEFLSNYPSWASWSTWWGLETADFSRCATIIGEYSETNLGPDAPATNILLVNDPMMVKENHRYDNGIDYAEYMLASSGTGRERELEGIYQELNSPYYPLTAPLVHRETFVPVKSSTEASQYLRGVLPEGYPEEVILHGTGFTTLGELQEQTFLAPPPQIVFTAVGLDLFHDWKTTFAMKPAIVTYWN